MALRVSKNLLEPPALVVKPVALFPLSPLEVETVSPAPLKAQVETVSQFPPDFPFARLTRPLKHVSPHEEHLLPDEDAILLGFFHDVPVGQGVVLKVAGENRLHIRLSRPGPGRGWERVTHLALTRHEKTMAQQLWDTSATPWRVLQKS